MHIEINTDQRSYTVSVNGKPASTYLFFAPVAQVERIVLRTGGPRFFPTPETPADQAYDLPKAGDAIQPFTYLIKSLKTQDVR